MNEIDYSLWLSAGAVALSAFTFYEKLYKSRAVIKIAESSSKLFYSKLEPTEGDPYYLLMSTTIINKSSEPISIHRFEFLSNETGLLVHDPFYSVEDEYTLGNGIYVEVSTNQHILPVKTLKPYESITGIIAFHHYGANSYGVIEEGIIKGKLTLRTSRKSFSKNINVASEGFIDI
ncbi:hypothetical protein [Jeotgalibacillus marinus]|uniref:DUF4352 domain-containing protein n=1 Tax=Jeotgalibacillus marinus TaxID=86667 RepID=A0ABV3Q3H7_9BACL